MANFWGASQNLYFLHFSSSEYWWFQTKQFTVLLEFIKLYKQNPLLLTFFISTIYWNKHFLFFYYLIGYKLMTDQLTGHLTAILMPSSCIAVSVWLLRALSLTALGLVGITWNSGSSDCTLTTHSSRSAMARNNLNTNDIIDSWVENFLQSTKNVCDIILLLYQVFQLYDDYHHCHNYHSYIIIP